MAASKESKPRPAFEVDIRSGRRAVAGAPDEPHSSRPLTVVAQRKAQARQRWLLALGGLGVVAVLVLGVVWWISRPPSDALARVNNEYITVGQVDKELLLNRALSALASNGQEVATTRGAILESLITQRMQAQDATRAGVQVSEADLDAWIAGSLQRNTWTAAQLDEALTGYGLTQADFRNSVRDTVLINQYIGQFVIRGARDQNQAKAQQNNWLAQLQSTSRVDRYSDPDEGTAPRVGATAPDFKSKDLDGRQVQLAGLRGRPVLINFWATWCQPCRIEIPTIVSTYKQLHPTGAAAQGLEVLAIAINSEADTVTAFRQEFGMPFPIIADTDNGLAGLYRVGPIPTSYLIDSKGIVRWVSVGAMDATALQKQLQALP